MNERPIAFRCAGFSLVEVAIVLLIVGLLLGGLLMPLSAQIDQQRNSDTKKAEDEIVQALIGYAVANGRLPCPATATLATGVANAGVANPPTAFSQILPATHFGCTPSTAPTQSAFALCSPGDNNVYLVPSPTATPLVQQIPAVIVSHGKNGLGAYTPAGTQMAGAAGDELTNANGGVNFRSYVPSNTFDDLVTWVSPNILMNRMVAAGKLP